VCYRLPSTAHHPRELPDRLLWCHCCFALSGLGLTHGTCWHGALTFTHRIMQVPMFWVIPCDSAQATIEGTIVSLRGQSDSIDLLLEGMKRGRIAFEGA